MTKLKIDLLNGILEVEGEESFVTKIYDDYKQKLDVNYTSDIAIKSKSLPVERSLTSFTGENIIKSKTTTKKKTSSRGESNKFIEIDGGVDTVQELKAFYEEKSPRNGFERNAVFVYFLQKNKGMTDISVDHIYSCHKLVEVPVPNALKQNLFDTAHRKHWINTTDMNNITITTPGENLVEHTLPFKSKE
jgi:hypothetical protein